MPLTSPGSTASHPGIRTSFASYYSPATILNSSAVATASVNTICYLPFYLPGQPVDRIVIEVTTGLAGLCRLGLYSNKNGIPDALIVDAGSVDTTNVAVVEATMTAITLPTDWIWAAAVFNAAAGIRGGATANTNILGSASPSTGARGLQGALTFGALPATAPVTTFAGGTCPWVGLRKS